MSPELKRLRYPFKTCFVITPYGTKKDADDNLHDFELVFEKLIQPALEGLIATTARSKDRAHSGVVHEDMFRQIITADVAICDLTTINPNVMYELGVRHAAKPMGTILIHAEGTKLDLPFNLRPVRVMSYPRIAPAEPSLDASGVAVPDNDKLDTARKTLCGLVERCLTQRRVDSPVHALIRNLNLIVPPKPLDTIAIGTFLLSDAGKDTGLPTSDAYPFAAHMAAGTVPSKPRSSSIGPHEASPVQQESVFASTLQKQTTAERASQLELDKPKAKKDRAEISIGVATGNLRDLYDIADVWVNPENTRMEMGPLFGESVSSYIRVLGSRNSRFKRDEFGNDDVQIALKSEVHRRRTILPGQAMFTTSGALKSTHGVHRVLHVAAQEGFPLSGFSTVKEPGTCVQRALEQIELHNQELACRWGFKKPLCSVLIPLFGTRNPNSDPVEVAKEIILAAKRHLDLEPTTQIKRILFLATTDQDLDLCERALHRLGYPLSHIKWEVLSAGEQVT